jgi:hypothetical protein
MEMQRRPSTKRGILICWMTEEQARLSGREFFLVEAPSDRDIMQIEGMIAEWKSDTFRERRQIRDDEATIIQCSSMLQDAMSRGDTKHAKHLREELAKFQATVK